MSDLAELAGLSEADVDAAAQAAKSRGLDGQWVLTLRNTTRQPALQSLTNRATREKLFKASWSRASRGDANDTRWAEMLDDDAFAWFEERGGLTRENGQRFRELISVSRQQRRLRHHVPRLSGTGSDHRADVGTTRAEGRYALDLTT